MARVPHQHTLGIHLFFTSEKLCAIGSPILPHFEAFAIYGSRIAPTDMVPIQTSSNGDVMDDHGLVFV